MRSKLSVVCLVMVGAALGGCTSDAIEVDDSSDGEWPTSPPLVESLPQCAEPLAIPGGKAWYGHIRGYHDGRIEPLGCGLSPESIPAKRFSVKPLYLDADEVTNGCYQHCVDAGACEATELWGDDHGSAPELKRYPAAVDLVRAETFCKWRGGRLPTPLELIRASHGSRPSAMSAVFEQEWLNCKGQSPAPASCRWFFDQGFFEAVPNQAPIRSEARDVGPYGHYDLFGSRCEALALPQAGPITGDKYCSLPDDAPDPGTFWGDASTQQGWFCPAPLITRMWPNNGDLGGVGGDLSTVVAFTRESREVKGFVLGLRCAYDPLE